MKKTKFSMQGLIEQNKREILNNKYEIEKIEKRIDEKYSMKTDDKLALKN